MKKSIGVGNNWQYSNTIYEYIKNAKLDGCDISLTDIKFILDDKWEENIHKLKEIIDRNNLECFQVHLPYHDMFLSSEIIPDDIKKAILNSIKAMEILECKWGAYHPRTSFTTVYSSEVAIKDNYNEISIYLEEAEKHNVGIAIENIPIFPDCPQYKFFSANYEELNYLVESFKSDKVGVCWDFGHANLMPVKQEKAFEILGDKIKIVHMHNNCGFHDDHVSPTLGTIDWKNVMPAFKKCGYNGVFSLELSYFDMKTELESYFAHGYDALCMLEKYFNTQTETSKR